MLRYIVIQPANPTGAALVHLKLYIQPNQGHPFEVLGLSSPDPQGENMTTLSALFSNDLSVGTTKNVQHQSERKRADYALLVNIPPLSDNRTNTALVIHPAFPFPYMSGCNLWQFPPNSATSKSQAGIYRAADSESETLSLISLFRPVNSQDAYHPFLLANVGSRRVVWP